MRCTLFLCLITIGAFSQTGPGGVGNSNGTSSLRMWYNTSAVVTTTGALIDSLKNLAGVTAFDMGETGGQRPTLISSAVNGFAEISFSGTNRLRTGLTLTATNFVTNEASTFLVVKADLTTQFTSVYTTDPLVGATRFSNHVPWGGTVYYDIGTCCSNSARIQVGGLSNLTSYSFWSYNAHPTTGKQLYRNGSLLQSRANSSTYSHHASQRFNIGGNTSGTTGFKGDVTELIVYNSKVNAAQRIIIENYLAAKYGLNSAANDLYNEDDAVNGNFDFEVAGIGRIDTQNLHDNAQGTGIISVSAPADLNNNEFFIWGHNNEALVFGNTTDIPTSSVKARLNRVWRVSEVNMSNTAVDVGAIDMTVDLTGVVGFNPSYPIYLLIDTDNDGNFDDETPIKNPVKLGGNQYKYTGVTAITNNMRFTFAFGFHTIITNRNTTFRVKKN